MRLKNDHTTTTEKTLKTEKPQRKKNQSSRSRADILSEVLSSVDLSILENEKYKFHEINNIPSLELVIKQFLKDDPLVVAVDTETEGLGWKHRIIGVSFSWSDEHNYYVPLRHLTEKVQLDIEDCRGFLNFLFSFEDKKYVFHNFKFDYHKLLKDDIHVCGEIHDTMLMHYVVDENESHALKNLAAKYIDPNAHKCENIISDIRRRLARKLKIGVRDFGFEHIPINVIVQYACRDTLYTWKLYEYFKPLIDKDSDRRSVYERELDLLPVLCEMEQMGAYIDQKLLQARSEVLGENLEITGKEVYELAGEEFDLNSPKQLADLLKRKGIHTHQYTPKGKMSTNAAALKNIAGRFPFIKKLLEYREKYKIKYTYTDPLRGHCDEHSFIHCSYMQAVAKTGRLTCKSPSLQTIPRSAGIRDAFVPPSDDFIIVPIDLSQIELRLTAHYSQDPILLRAYQTEEDIHTRTAAEIFDVEMEEVTPEQRTMAKPINFGILYGMGPSKLADELKVSQTEATGFINRYFERYVGVAKFVSKYKRLVKRDGFVKNYFGRVRHLDDLVDPNLELWKREHGYRQAVNFVIQSTAADMFKVILVRCHDILKDKLTSMVMNIHDEVVFYWHKDELGLLPEIVKAFENWEFGVPIVAEVSYSEKSWGEKRAW